MGWACLEGSYWGRRENFCFGKVALEVTIKPEALFSSDPNTHSQPPFPHPRPQTGGWEGETAAFLVPLNTTL